MSDIDWTVPCPMPDCDHETTFAAFVDEPDTGCSECGASLDRLRAEAQDRDS